MLLKQHHGACALSPCTSSALNGGQCLLALYDRSMEGYWLWRCVYVWVDLQSGLCPHLFFLGTAYLATFSHIRWRRTLRVTVAEAGCVGKERGL